MDLPAVEPPQPTPAAVVTEKTDFLKEDKDRENKNEDKDEKGKSRICYNCGNPGILFLFCEF